MNTKASGAPAKTDTQVSCTVPITTQKRSAIGSMQWFLEKGKDASAPVFHHNSLDYFICGEDAFQSIAARIKRAQKSIDIVCWGFDPAMELTRSQASHWPRGETWASLLLGAASGEWTHGKPVQVRLLCWFDRLGGMDNNLWGNNNMPGYMGWGQHAPLSDAQKQQLLAWSKPGTALKPSEQRERREWVNQRWFALAASGQLPSLSLRIRNGDAAAIHASMGQADPLRDGKPMHLADQESTLMEKFGTYHQKTVLIDYDEDGHPEARPTAYVMGLNSVTDYWDTREHRHTDPRRGQGWESVMPSQEASLKPYQDYATRIQGEALVMVAKNFTEAWNDPGAIGSGSSVSRRCDPKAPPAHLTKHLLGTGRSVQILRTEPKAQPAPEQGIERLYYQTAASARQYIYIENQYFQYAPWIKVLKAQREAYVKLHRSCGTAKDQVPDLHLMVVTPTPERAGMVPRTHDAIKELGFGSSMPHQTQRAEEDLRRYKADMAHYESQLEKYQQAKHLAPGSLPPPVKPRPLSDVSRTYLESGGDKTDEQIQKDLRLTMGLRTLVASLWTFDQASKERFREIYIHSKLMIADDSMFTIGSANMNARSFYGDGELNMVTDCPDTSARLRQEVWAMHSGGGDDFDGGDGSLERISKAFKNWRDLIQRNGELKLAGEKIQGFLVPLNDTRTSETRVG